MILLNGWKKDFDYRVRKSFFPYFDVAACCCHMVRHFNFNISMPLMLGSNISMEAFSFLIGKTEREKIEGFINTFAKS